MVHDDHWRETVCTSLQNNPSEPNVSPQTDTHARHLDAHTDPAPVPRCKTNPKNQPQRFPPVLQPQKKDTTKRKKVALIVELSKEKGTRTNLGALESTTTALDTTGTDEARKTISSLCSMTHKKILNYETFPHKLISNKRLPSCPRCLETSNRTPCYCTGITDEPPEL